MTLPGLDTHELRPVSPHERVMECTRCRQPILVCGAVSDIDPETFVGLACGCRLQSAPARQLRAVIDQARRAQAGEAA